MKSMVRRAATVVGVAAAAVLACAAPAWAHVTVNPGSAAGGDWARVDFRVPNESDKAVATKLEVSLPADHPLASVETAAVEGWKVTTSTRKLDKPLDMEGRKISTVVSKITWTADSKKTGVQVGQFAEFPVSLGQLPKKGSLVFKAIQTYSDGDVVRWIDLPKKDGSEPENPAPVLTIDSAAADGDGSAAASSKDSGDSAPTVMSAVALGLGVVAVVVAALAFTRARRRRED
ncbi:MAG TPA: YcnI family protein [Stackebrandtia sp.]|uniref:YcnI family protein n=1 Tax=Stackebrandtia sp. TaxID=2023065 RepID=UPI002D5D9981|nr:YcnI family protein [Stackebrandtia sp.]HZE37507.1 YcnI family protein [Stackebrandtia sp.]